MDYSTYTQAKYHEAQPLRLTHKHELDSEPRSKRRFPTDRIQALTRKLHVAHRNPVASH